MRSSEQMLHGKGIYGGGNWNAEAGTQILRGSSPTAARPVVVTNSKSKSPEKVRRKESGAQMQKVAAGRSASVTTVERPGPAFFVTNELE